MNDEERNLDVEVDEFDTDDAGLEELMPPELGDEVVLSEEGAIDDLDVAENELPEQVQESLPDIDPPEQEFTETGMNSDPLAEVAAIAAERNAEATKQGPAVAESKGARYALGGIALLALVTAAFAAWQAYSNSMRMEEIATALQQRNTAKPSAGKRDDGAIQVELEKLATQVNQVAATLDGSLMELRENNKAAQEAIEQRLDKLEKAYSGKMETTIKEEPVTAAAKPPMEEATAPTDSPKTTGAWSVNLISLSSEKDADKELTHLRNLGIRAEKHRVEQDGRIWFRLRVPGFTSRDGAMAYIETVKKKAGLSNAWIGKD